MALVIWRYGVLQRFFSINSPVTYLVSDPGRNYGPQISQIPAPGMPIELPPVFSKPGALPHGFPQDLIIERDIIFKQSWRQEHPGEQYAYLLVEYVSKRSLEEHKEYFSDYFAKRGWEFIQNAMTQADANEGRLDAVKGEDGVRIAMVQIPTGEVGIQVSYRQNGRQTIEQR